MEQSDRKIKVHRLLHELFGREITYTDLSFIFIGGIILTVIIQMLCVGSDLTTLKKIILAVLTLDIGGGVVANFTEGTNNYYWEDLKKRYLFILIHIFQPLILLWIFPNNFYAVMVVTLFTLVISFTVTSIKEKSSQKTLSITAWLIGICLIFLLNFSMPVIQLILNIYVTKLVVAFSVNWTK
jgi:hypothetical protein